MSVKDDILRTVERWRYWMYLAVIRLQLKHSQTRFGSLWEPLTVQFVAGVLAIVWAQVLDMESRTDYFLYVLSGFLFWSFLSSLVKDSVSSFRRNVTSLRSYISSLTGFLTEDITFCTLRFLISLPFVLIWCFALAGLDPIGLLTMLGGIVLAILSAYGLGMSLGVLAFFVGDVQQLVNAMMRLGFLVTPVIWSRERLGEYADLAWFNPFYSYLDICRSGLLGHEVDSRSYIVAISITVILLVVGLITLKASERRIRVKVFAS